MQPSRSSQTSSYTPKPSASSDAESALDLIAIIGIGCRFPGIHGPEAFWNLVVNGQDAITEIPPDRFDIAEFYDPRPNTPGKIITREGGFLREMDQFDAAFFGIAPREAAPMDPQHRLLLEATWEALEDAGQTPARLAGQPTGVFIGLFTSDYEQQQYRNLADIDIYVCAGITRSMAAGRISYALGLQGPSLVVDTACSSSLVAVHLACQSLRTGESALALAGGVNLVLDPGPSIAFSKGNMLAPDGRCKAFDARGDGFVRSEGCAVVALKPLSRALADNDPIYAVIRGSAVNNDGRSGGYLMTPSQAGQEEVLRLAYRNARLPAESVQYVEAHGTGTNAGDPIELQALGAVLCEERPHDRPLIVGSVKTNIGHTEGAAGMAGLIKAALSLKHRTIPANLHFSEPNPKIPWHKLPIVIPQASMPWPTDDAPALAGVSGFGISGTNAHIVLEEAPRVPRRSAEEATQPQILTLSAHTPAALQAKARDYRDWIDHAAANGTLSLSDLCYTSNVRRAAHDYRLAIVGNSAADLVEQLTAYAEESDIAGVIKGQALSSAARKLVFVFPGQGSQWIGMGRGLLAHEPVFHATIARCDQIARQFIDWSLLDYLTGDRLESGLNEVDRIQPILFAVQIALAAVWQSWGIVPDAVVGQSMGEVAAAYVSGALSLEDALRVICMRSQILQRQKGKGAMAVVELSIEQAEQVLRGYEDRVSVAVNTSPSSSVLAGEPSALHEILESLQQQGVFHRLIKAEIASHSPYMDVLLPDLIEALEPIRPRQAAIPMYSTVTSTVVDGADLDAQYWARNLRQPVRVSTSVQQLLENDFATFVELSPHPILLTALQQSMAYLGRSGTVLPSMRREEDEQSVILRSLGSLYTLGWTADWRSMYPPDCRCVTLPIYPWQHERFWKGVSRQDHQPEAYYSRVSTGSARAQHPLLGMPFSSAIQPDLSLWEANISATSIPYAVDHRVQGAVILPSTAYLDMALAAITAVFGPGDHSLEQVSFQKALFIPADGVQTLQFMLSAATLGTATFKLFSRPVSASNESHAWTLHVTGTARIGQPDRATALQQGTVEQLRQIQAAAHEVLGPEEHYRRMSERGLHYGPSFQGVATVWRQGNEAAAQIQHTETVVFEADRYQIHPALLDACFQVAALLLPEGTEHDTYVPVALKRLRLHQPQRPRQSTWSYTRILVDADQPQTVEADLVLLDDDGQIVLEACGVRMQRIDRAALAPTEQRIADWLFTVEWQEQAPAHEREMPDRYTGTWLILADQQGVSTALAALLESVGAACIMVTPGRIYRQITASHYQLPADDPGALQMFLRDAFDSNGPPCRGIVHLWSLNATSSLDTTADTLMADQSLGSSSSISLVQSLIQCGWDRLPRLWLVTGGVQPAGDADALAIAQSPVWGVGKVLTYEHPELRSTSIDLSLAPTEREIEALFAELGADSREDEIALRGDKRYVARLTRYTPPTGAEAEPAAPQSAAVASTDLADASVYAAISGTARRSPRSGEIEIRVHAVGLAASSQPGLSVLQHEQQHPQTITGWQCAGVVVACGADVAGLAEGDAVIAIAPDCCRTFTTTLAALAIPKPEHLSFATAAAMPAAFVTAHYALRQLGRLSSGERALILATGDGVGLAAAHIARIVGAECFAIATTPEHHEYLAAIGVEHVLDVQSVDVAAEVQRLTQGEGVDILLSALPGSGGTAYSATLRPYGRFVDVAPSSRMVFETLRPNQSFFAIDICQLIQDRPDRVGVLLGECMEYLLDRRCASLPAHIVPLSAADARLSHTQYLGGVVLTELEKTPEIIQESVASTLFRSDGTYLITGGLGGLGLTVAQWLVDHGGRHLVLVGRSGAPASAQQALAQMRQQGAEIVVARADVAVTQQVDDLLSTIRETMPPLRGIIHAAAILDDGIVLQMNRARLESVMAPKVRGAWNLHRSSLNDPLDLFVLFSSVASLIGSPGQVNYVAANTFLDTLAHHRQRMGYPALSINWGAWAQVGLATRSDRGERLAFRGIASFTLEQGLEAFALLLRQTRVQVGVMPFNIRQWQTFYTAAAAAPFFAELSQEISAAQEQPGEAAAGSSVTRAALLKSSPDTRQQLIEAYLGEQIMRVLGFSASKLSAHQTLSRLGFDSLMSVELKNRIEADFGVAVPVVTFLQDISLSHLASQVLAELTKTADTQPTTPVLSEHIQPTAAIDELSDEEVTAMLTTLLAQEDA